MLTYDEAGDCRLEVLDPSETPGNKSSTSRATCSSHACAAVLRRLAAVDARRSTDVDSATCRDKATSDRRLGTSTAAPASKSMSGPVAALSADTTTVNVTTTV